MIKLSNSYVGLSEHNPVNLQDTTFYPHGIYKEHSHDYYEMFIILEGTMHHQLNAVPILLNPGSVCIIRPDDVHTIGNPSNINTLHLINIVFRREIFDDTLLFLNNSINFSIEDNSCCVKKTSDMERKMLIERVELIRKFSEKSDYTPMKILCVKSLIIDFMLMLYQRTMLSYGNAPEWLISTCREMQKIENFNRGLPRFIALAGKSQEHLTRYMKKYYNETPQALITRLRINEAARQLRNTRKTIDEIMYDTGFKNVSYFRRCFLRQYGDPPGRYLRKSRSIFNPQR